MNTDQDSGGFLPPTTTVFTNLQLSSSKPSTGFVPQPSPASPQTTSDVTCTTQESDLTAAIDRAIIKIQDAVLAAATNPIRRTKSVTTYHQEHPTTTARNPLRRTVSDTKSPATRRRKIWPPSSSRNSVPESSSREEAPNIKRLKKMEEVVMEIEQRFRDLRRESKEQENVGDDKPSKQILEPDEGGEERVGFKRLNEDEECVGFNRLDDGALRIKMRCSCHKHFEILHNHIGCFYRLI